MRLSHWFIWTFVLAVGGALAFAGSPEEKAAVTTPGAMLARSELHASDPFGRLPDVVILPRREVMRVGLEVLVDGRPAPTVTHQGRTYLPVHLGTEYEIRVWNEGPRRVTAVVSVDGLSVLDSRPASAAGAGYLVGPSDSVRIKGWRRDQETVAAFRFVDREDSYAARVGRPENVGVIGLIAIEELSRWPRLPVEKRSAGESALSGAYRDVGGTGTGRGRDLDSPVDHVPFVRGHNRMSITLYYDTVENLRRAGIPVDDSPPNPFPGDRLPAEDR